MTISSIYGYGFAHKLADIPTTAHFAVLVENRQSWSYDRPNDSVLEYIEYRYFDNQEQLEGYLYAQDEKGNTEKMLVIQVRPVTIQKTLSIKVHCE